MLRPDEETDRERLRDLLARAFLLVHPTREDTSPLVVTEAAYFGCPAISVNQFALPELVIDGKTGVLLQPPLTAQQLAGAIERLLTERARYQTMRRAARQHAMENYQWDRIGDAMAEEMRRCMGRG